MNIELLQDKLWNRGSINSYVACWKYDDNIYAFKKQNADFDTNNYSNRENSYEADIIIYSMSYIKTYRS